jgi:adenosylhomocysteine nucleosidase
MTRTAIIAAMPAELKPLVRSWKHERSNGVDLWRWSFDGGEWIAACAGAGVDAATRAFAAVETDGSIDLVISTGWAGALSDEITPSRTYRVSGVVDARTGERIETADWVVTEADGETRTHPSRKDKDAARVGHPDLWLVTSALVADAAEKQRLAVTYKAELVDMEAAGVARLARMRGIPFYCIKGISDGYNYRLPDFNRFLSSSGKFQLARFVLFVILRPWHWPALTRMGENSRKAACAIAASVFDLLDERGHQDKLNGNSNRQR